MSAGKSKYQTGGSGLDKKPTVGVPGGGSASSVPQTVKGRNRRDEMVPSPSGPDGLELTNRP